MKRFHSDGRIWEDVMMKAVFRNILLICFAVIGSVYLSGCKDSVTAPFGTTISIQPADISAETPDIRNIYVTVTDANGTPMNGIEIFISGSGSKAGLDYIFNTGLSGSGLNVAGSAFPAATNDYGVYEFSIITVNPFSDTIEIVSNTAYASIDISSS